jgi:hypothetical protein
MGGSSSKPTVLECMPKHFKKGFLGEYTIKMSPGRLCTLCELEWPTFGLNCPPEGSLNLPTVRAIYQVVIGTLRHPNHFPYIDSWTGGSDHAPLGQILHQQKGTEQSFHGPGNEEANLACSSRESRR